MASYSSPHDSQFFTRRAITFTIAVAVQILIVALLSTGLASRVINIVAPPIQTDIVQEVQKHEEAPPPPPPKMERPPVEVPPPDVTINIPSETRTTAITNTTTRHVAKAPPPPPPRVAGTRATVNPKHIPNTSDFYPPASQRLSEEGTTTIQACVGANARLTSDPKVIKSSGHTRLDEAAVKLAKAAGQGAYVPATEDGKPVGGGCVNFNVIWRLQ
jgi:periplasmic protein TonB